MLHKSQIPQTVPQNRSSGTVASCSNSCCEPVLVITCWYDSVVFAALVFFTHHAYVCSNFA